MGRKRGFFAFKFDRFVYTSSSYEVNHAKYRLISSDTLPFSGTYNLNQPWTCFPQFYWFTSLRFNSRIYCFSCITSKSSMSFIAFNHYLFPLINMRRLVLNFLGVSPGMHRKFVIFLTRLLLIKGIKTSKNTTKVQITSTFLTYNSSNL